MTIRSRLNSKTCFFREFFQMFPYISTASVAAKLSPKVYVTVKQQQLIQHLQSLR